MCVPWFCHLSRGAGLRKAVNVICAIAWRLAAHYLSHMLRAITRALREALALQEVPPC